MDSQPDSAALMLERVRPQLGEMSEADEKYFQLLRLKHCLVQKLSFKDGREVKDLVAYYEQGGDKKLLPSAYYYAGCFFHRENDVPRAIDYLQKSQSLLENGNDQKLLARCDYTLGYIFNEQQLWQEALEALHQSQAVNVAMRDTARILFTSIELAWAYVGADSSKLAIDLLRRSELMAWAVKDTATLSEISCQLAKMYHRAKEESLAHKYLSMALRFSRPGNYSALYSIAWHLYDDWGQEDSVKYYCERLLQVGNLNARRTACKRLGEYYEGKDDEKSRYMQLQYGALTDTMDAVSAVEYAAQASGKYNYKMHEEARRRLEKANFHKKVILVVLVLTLVMLMAWLMWYYLHFKKTGRKALLKLKAMKLIWNEDRQRNLNQHLRDREKISLLEKKMSQMINPVAVSSTDSKKMRETALYQELAALVEKGEKMSDNQVASLARVVRDVFPSYPSQMLGFQKMNELETLVCLLLKADFSFTEISVLTCRSIDTIYSVCRRLYHKNFHEEGTSKKWRTVIQRDIRADGQGRG